MTDMTESSSNSTNQDDQPMDQGKIGSDFVHVDWEDVPQHIEQYGLNGIEAFFRRKLEKWKDVDINIGVTGNSGTGKSSFINAIRGLRNDDEGAAATGPTETTTEPTQYAHPTNDKIIFWDLPGVGTKNFPVGTYSEDVDLPKYDTFLILSATRFTENDLMLAQMVQSIGKSFFFVRTKIDFDVWNESQDRPKTFDEDTVLEEIKKDCLKNLEEFQKDKNVPVFLISNRKTAKWDFGRLTQAILDCLPIRQKECLTLSLDVMTTCSMSIFKRKVEVLRGRIVMVATASGIGALIPLPGLSIALDISLLIAEVRLYMKQLGLPDENSDQFKGLRPEIQEKIKKFCLTSAVQVGNLVAAYGASSAVEEFTRFIPFVGSAIAGGISFSSTYYFLHGCLNEMEETALEFLESLNTRLADDLPLD